MIMKFKIKYGWNAVQNEQCHNKFNNKGRIQLIMMLPSNNK